MGRAPDDAGPPDDALAGIGRELEHLVRYRTEVDRRLVRAGVGSVGELMRLHETVRRALDALSRQELDWTRERVERLVARLGAQADQLERLRALKRQLDQA